MDVTSVFKEYYSSSLPRGPVLHFTSPSATPHQEHHQHKDKATGARELTPARKIFIMSLSEKSHIHRAAEASSETEAAVAQQKTDRQVFKKSSNSFFQPQTSHQHTASFR
jgi:hypothetical protein